MRRLKFKIALLLIALWLLIAALFPNTVFPNSWFERFNTQAVHLRQVRAHIESIQPQWLEFRRLHPEMDKVYLSEWTGGDGMFAAFGQVPSEAAALTVSNFMQSTKPPRPIYLKALLVREDDTNDASAK